MARAGRKQLAVQIKEESFDRLEEIKQETGLSNAKLIEMLIENYSGTNINTSTNTGITEEQLRKILKEELSCININTSTNTKEKQSTNTNINTSTTPKPKKEKKKPEPTPEPVLVPEPAFHEKDHYLLRKPCYEGKPETQHTRKSNLMVEWWLEEGDSQYYDENKSIIPFRYKKADGTDYTPTKDEIKKLEEEYEKPVVIEN